MKNLITVIIPFFNEEKNIVSCLNTLRQQSCQNFSVIFINDGSTDNTLNELKKAISQTPPSFTYDILCQTNSGAAKAREYGINKAVTNYVMLLDFDDCLSHNTIDETIKSIHKYNYPDISLPYLKVQDKNGQFNTLRYFDDREYYTGLESLEYSLGSWKIHGVMCVKKSICIQSFQYYKSYNPEERNYINNDEVITRLNFYIAESVVKNQGIYYYHANQESTTKKIHPHRYLIFHNARILYFLFGKNMGLISINCHKELIDSLWHTRGYFKSHKNQFSNKKEWKNEMRSMTLFILSQRKILNLPYKTTFKLIKRYISLAFI